MQAVVADDAVRSSSPRLADLCAFSVIKRDAPAWWFFLLSLYAPVGAALVVLRVCAAWCIGVILLQIRQWPWFSAHADVLGTYLVRALLFIWGIRVLIDEHAERALLSDCSPVILVANHLTQIDALPFRSLMPVRAVVRENYGRSWMVGTMLRAAMDPIFVPTPLAHANGPEGERAARAHVREEVQAYVHSPQQDQRRAARHRRPPLIYFPEGSITNGRGLMRSAIVCMHKPGPESEPQPHYPNPYRFSAFVFSLGLPVQPVAIRVTSPVRLSPPPTPTPHCLTMTRARARHPSP